VFYFTRNHVQNPNKVISSAEEVLKLFSELFRRQWSCRKIFASCNKPVK